MSGAPDNSHRILQYGPSAHAFTALRACLDSDFNPAQSLSRRRETDAELQDWPDDYRRALVASDSLAQMMASLSWPLVRELEVADTPEHDHHATVRFLAAAPEAGELRRITLPEGLDDEDITEIVRSPHLKELQNISISVEGLSAGSFRMLATSALLKRLRKLSISFFPPASADDLQKCRLLLGNRNLDNLRYVSLSFPPADFIEDLNRFHPVHLDALRVQVFSSDDGAFDQLCDAHSLLAGLTELILPSCELTDSDVQRLMTCIGEGRLASLSLSQNNLSESGISHLLSFGSRHRLSELDLQLNPLGDKGWTRIAGLDAGRLRRLCLDRTKGGDAGLAALATAPFMNTLEHLDFNRNQISPDGMDEFISSAKCDRLKTLSFDENPLANAGASALSSSEWAHLKSLSLRDIGMDAAGLSALFDGTALRSLTSFQLDGNDLHEAEFVESGEPLFPTGLQVLTLAGCNLGDGGIAALQRSDSYHALRVLRLGVNQIDDSELANLARTPSLSKLWVLDLKHNPFGDAGLKKVLDGLSLNELHELRLEGTSVTLNGLEYAKKKCPSLKILVHQSLPLWTR